MFITVFFFFSQEKKLNREKEYKRELRELKQSRDALVSFVEEIFD